MVRRDYYAILGISKDATPDDVKRAYRARAMQYHPDRNPDDPEAERHFKEVVEAYETLSDPERRQRYDRVGPFYHPDGRPPSPDEVNELLARTLGGIFKRRKDRQPGADVHQTVTISLAQVALGQERILEVPRQVRCARCGGTGGDPDGGWRQCDDCDGSGRVATPRWFRTTCPRCEGKGRVLVRTCGRCNGEGRHGSVERLKVRIPPGVAHGQKLKVKEKGDDPRGEGATGDLLVSVHVAAHPLFQRRGADLLCDLPLTFPEAVSGGEVEVPTLDGGTRIVIPPGTPNGKVLRLGGRGLPRLDGGARGSIHFRVQIEVPVNLSAEQRQALARLAAHLDLVNHPRRQAFEQARQQVLGEVVEARRAREPGGT